MTRKASPRIRLDKLIVEQGLATDLAEARALLMRGAVHAGDTKLKGPATLVEKGMPLRLRGRVGSVSRGGAKLQAALRHWQLDLRGLRCLDVGASTGGFTQVMLRAGARQVVAVDAGTHQLAYELRRDPRVISVEKTDIRDLSPHLAEPAFEFASIDVSFIRLGKVFPALADLLAPQAKWVALVKPQFELPPSQVAKGGVVRDAGLQAKVVQAVVTQARAAGLGPSEHLASPVLGTKGNQEFLLLGQKI